MARAILLAGAVVWSAAFLAALALALVGVEELVRLLPPLAVDVEAVGGAVTAVAVVLGIGAAAHVVVLAGIRAGRSRARSAATLLTALLTAAFLALAAASFTSAATSSATGAGGAGWALVAAGVGAAAAALGYAVATVRLAVETRSGSAS